MDHLFVYGTLAPGERNAHIMEGMVGNWRRASVRGKRFESGWGRHKGAPGFYPNPQGEIVHGLIFSSDDLPAHWDRLDAFEGSDYDRVPIIATLETGDTIEAYIYRAIPRS